MGWNHLAYKVLQKKRPQTNHFLDTIFPGVFQWSDLTHVFLANGCFKHQNRILDKRVFFGQGKEGNPQAVGLFGHQGPCRTPQTRPLSLSLQEMQFLGQVKLHVIPREIIATSHQIDAPHLNDWPPHPPFRQKTWRYLPKRLQNPSLEFWAAPAVVVPHISQLSRNCPTWTCC